MRGRVDALTFSYQGAIEFALFVLATKMLSMTRNLTAKTRGRIQSRAVSLSGPLLPLENFALGPNTFRQFLREEEGTSKETQFKPREVQGVHYTSVEPESVPAPYLIAASSSCARDIGLDPLALYTKEFLLAFSGSNLLPGLDKPWSSVYGCHCYGHWFGQLGDGRAMSLGETAASDTSHELQLKGCGRSPYSRGFDGRAVIRSNVREFLMSEAMHHLGVSTTRALSIIGTGMTVYRPWYKGNSKQKDPRFGRGSFPPDQMQAEPGAVLCRTARSFIRFGQLELFAKRKQYEQLVELADYACLREFPHLLNSSDIIGDDDNAEKRSILAGNPQRYVNLFKEIGYAAISLVVDWLRVGYVQGNMNSDNTLVGGRTLDYGPYGLMEKYNPMYQPFTSDQERKFAFAKQPTAMHVNVMVLGGTFSSLLRYRCEQLGLSDKNALEYEKEIAQYCKEDFQAMFQIKYQQMLQNKLGFDRWTEKEQLLYEAIDRLIYESGMDFTIFYRQLSTISSSDTPSAAFLKLQNSFYSKNTDDLKHAQEKWIDLLPQYLHRISQQEVDDKGLSASDRVDIMESTNPKYVLRNWMAVLAYEAAIEGDTSIVEELQNLLEDPYETGGRNVQMEGKYYRTTPDWAQQMPGAEFLS